MSRRLLAPVLALSLATACSSPEAPAPEPAAAAAPAASAAAPAGSGWSQFGGSADRSRRAQGSGPRGAPGILWSALIEEKMASEALVARTDQGLRVLVCGSSGLYAIDHEDGRVAWEADAKGAISSTAALAGSRIWLGSLDGFGLFLDPADGSELDEYEADFPFDAPAFAVAGGVGLEETSMQGRHGESRFHFVDASTGKKRWHHDYRGGAGSPPASDGERIYVQAAASVTALDLEGRVVWMHERKAHSQLIGPAVAGGRVIVHSVPRLPMGSLRALDAATGELLWEQTVTDRALAAPALDAEALYLVVVSGKLQRRVAATGALEWEVELPARAESAPVLAGELVFVGGPGFVGAWSAADGSEVWRMDLDGEAAFLSVDGGSLFVATYDGFLHRIASAS